MRILYLTFNAPPVENIASYRTKAFLTYLPKEGIEVDVLTRYYDDLHFIANDFEAMKSDATMSSVYAADGPVYATSFYNYVNRSALYRFTRGPLRVLMNLYLVDPFYAAWEKLALDYFEAHLTHKRYDVIIATYNPLISFRVAQRLSRKLGIPWMAEYRDSFVLDTDSGNSLLYKRLVQHRALRGVSKIIAVSEAIAQQVRDSLFASKKTTDIVLVRNGYDEQVQPAIDPADAEVWAVLQELKPRYSRLLLHTGTVYEGQNYHFFTECLQQYNSCHPEKIAFVFVGLKQDSITNHAFTGADVYCYPKVAQCTSLYLQQWADALLLPAWHTASTRSFPAKTYEYLWFGKKVLCSPAPPVDFAAFLHSFSNACIMNDYRHFETLMDESAKDQLLQNAIKEQPERKLLTRRYWMQQLAKVLTEIRH